MSESKVAAVLGVGPRLGAAIVRRFAREGFAVGLMARSEERLTPLQTEIEKGGGTALSITADATEPASVTSAFQKVKQQLGTSDVFVYNTGACLTRSNCRDVLATLLTRSDCVDIGTRLAACCGKILTKTGWRCS